MHTIRFLFLIAVYLGINLRAEDMKNLNNELNILLPKAVENWQPVEPDNFYTPENLFEYINGGAELYLSYGFRVVMNRIYYKKDQPDIIVDIFDMGNSKNAFGLFMHSRENIDTLFGQGSEYASGMLIFWKDHYFISILAFPENEELKNAVFKLAGIIENKIKKDGPLPVLINYLPQRSLHKKSIRYFKHYIWLNSYFFIADQNILKLSADSEALMAKYGSGKNPHYLLLMKYATPEKAADALASFTGHYLPEIKSEGIVRVEDGLFTGCAIKGSHLIIVFNAPDKNRADELLRSVKKLMEVK